MEAKAKQDLVARESDNPYRIETYSSNNIFQRVEWKEPLSRTIASIDEEVKNHQESLSKKQKNGRCLKYYFGSCGHQEKIPYTQEELTAAGLKKKQELIKKYAKQIKSGEVIKSKEPYTVRFCQNEDVKPLQWKAL